MARTRRTMLGSGLLGLGLAVLTCAASAGPHLRYAGSSHLPQSARRDPFLLRKYLYPALKEAGIVRIEIVAGSDSVVQERSLSGMMYLDGIPPAALHAVLLVLPGKQAGAEIDLWVQGNGTPGDPDRMWTVRRDLTGRIVVLKGDPPPALDGPDPSALELAARFGIGRLEDSADARWRADERRMLQKALELLSPRELELIAGLSFRRARLSAKGNTGLHTGSDAGDPGHITLFDAAFRTADGFTRYAGSPQDAVPRAVLTMLHEIGHAIADAERHRLLVRRRAESESYDARNAKYAVFAKDYERHRNLQGAEAERRREELWPELQVLKIEMEEHVHAIRSIDAAIAQARTGPQSVEGRYATLPGATDGPTEYGSTAQEESFAEAFALYHVDPESLRWIAPRSHEWFAAEEHLRSAETTLPDVAAPADADPGTSTAD